MSRPDYIPETLYLITADGEWPIHCAETEQMAVGLANDRKRKSPDRRIRITKVIISDGQPLEVQREVIREWLVPEGTAVTA